MRVQTDNYHTGIADGLAGSRDEAAAIPGVPETMGGRIRGLRKGRRLSLDKLARAAGCSKSYLWGLETEASPRPSADKLGKLAAVLGVTIDHLVGGGEGVSGMEKMRAACLEAVWEEVRGWQSARTFSSSAEIMAGRMEQAIRAIDARKLAD